MAERDERGFPVRGTRNPDGMVSVRLEPDDLGRLADLRAKWEREVGQALTRTDCVIACIRQTHAREIAGPNGSVQGGSEGVQPAADPTEPGQPCGICAHVEPGNDIKCLGCGRGLSAVSTPGTEAEGRPHPQKLVRKKKRA